MTDELDDGARDLIRQALSEETRATPVALAHIRTRVLASALAVSSAAGATQVAGTAQAAGAVGKTFLAAVSAPVLKTLVVGSLALGGAATLAVSLPSEAPRPAPAQVTPPAGQREVAPTVFVPAEPLRTELPTRPSDAVPAPLPAELTATKSATPSAPQLQPAPSAPSAESQRPSLSEELAVLQRAQALLNAGDGKGALRLLDETAVAHGGGQLSVERAAVEILAACQAGELQRADRLARAFLATHPNVPAAARVRGSCAGEGR